MYMYMYMHVGFWNFSVDSLCWLCHLDTSSGHFGSSFTYASTSSIFPPTHPGSFTPGNCTVDFLRR